MIIYLSKKALLDININPEIIGHIPNLEDIIDQLKAQQYVKNIRFTGSYQKDFTNELKYIIEHLNQNITSLQFINTETQHQPQINNSIISLDAASNFLTRLKSLTLAGFALQVNFARMIEQFFKNTPQKIQKFLLANHLFQEEDFLAIINNFKQPMSHVKVFSGSFFTLPGHNISNTFIDKIFKENLGLERLGLKIYDFGSKQISFSSAQLILMLKYIIKYQPKLISFSVTVNGLSKEDIIDISNLINLKEFNLLNLGINIGRTLYEKNNGLENSVYELLQDHHSLIFFNNKPLNLYSKFKDTVNYLKTLEARELISEIDVDFHLRQLLKYTSEVRLIHGKEDAHYYFDEHKATYIRAINQHIVENYSNKILPFEYIVYLHNLLSSKVSITEHIECNLALKNIIAHNLLYINYTLKEEYDPAIKVNQERAIRLNNNAELSHVDQSWLENYQHNSQSSLLSIPLEIRNLISRFALDGLIYDFKSEELKLVGELVDNNS